MADPLAAARAEHEKAIERAREIGREVTHHFTREPGMVFQREAGIGRHGGALVFAENDRRGDLQRRLVVKYSLGKSAADIYRNADADLRNEYHCLNALTGAEHIVQRVDLPGAFLPLPGGPLPQRDEPSLEELVAELNNTVYDFSSLNSSGWPWVVAFMTPLPTAFVLSSLLLRSSFMALALPPMASWARGLAEPPPRNVVRDGGAAGGNDNNNDNNYEDDERRDGWETTEDELLRPEFRIPTFGMEFLEGGTLTRFHRRLLEDRQLIPNRLAWKIWLCMVRQVMAMANPPYPPGTRITKGRVIRETIRDDGTPYDTITQNSTHLDNFMFGSFNPDMAHYEHLPNMPTLKLIDFGRGRRERPRTFDWARTLPDPSHCGSKINIFNAANAFVGLILVFATDDELAVEDEELPYRFTAPDGRAVDIFTSAPMLLRESEMMDRELRDLICRCMASDPNDIPSLQELFETAGHQAVDRDPYADVALALKMGVQETDEYIAAFIQRYILDPDIQDT